MVQISFGDRNKLSVYLRCEGLSFKYPGRKDHLFKDVFLDVSAGEIVAIRGQNGRGKTSLFYCLSGIIPNIYHYEVGGDIWLMGENIRGKSLPNIARQLGMVFQDPDTQLFSPFSEDEVAFGPENLCMEQQEIIRRVDEALETVNMQKYRQSSPDKLSGGQKQLIALASTLALNPSVLLFDEAMSQLDDEAAGMIMKMILDLKKKGKAIVMIDHEEERLKIADRVFALEDAILKPCKAGA